MMRGSKWFLLINFCLLFALPDKDLTHYNRGIDAYKNNQFKLSVQEFEAILDQGWSSSELFYNLGNAYYRLGDISGAIWSYESCLKVKPNHKDAKYNLKLANVRVKDRVSLPDPPFYLNIYLLIKQQFPPYLWFSICSLLLLLFVCFYTIKKYIIMNLLQYISNFILIIFFVSMFIMLHVVIDERSSLEGIINYDKTKVYSEPNTVSTYLFEINKGHKVEIGNMNSSWFEFELLDGKIGWVEKDKIRLIE